ncbi:hypothetical protein GCM10009579_65940 [Streptomyces javensis]|uniref:Uncharacterized protein n=1 Tax=Streptomyces javensis TaxID=114698 RepID=A0ABN1XBP2_9ACTN
MPGGAPVGTERGELGLPRFLARLPDHPGLGRVQQQLAPFLQLSGPQRLSLLVDPSPERKRLGRPDFDLDVIRDGVEACDAVVLPPAQQRLVALKPDQGLGPVHPRTEEGRDRRGVARAGEVQQGRFGGGLRVVQFLVLAAGPDDPPVFVATDVDLALAAGERAGGELLDHAFRVRAQGLYL